MRLRETKLKEGFFHLTFKMQKTQAGRLKFANQFKCIPDVTAPAFGWLRELYSQRARNCQFTEMIKTNPFARGWIQYGI